MHDYYEEKLWHEIIGEIITGNYELVYYVAENVGIIGILAYPKTDAVWIISNALFYNTKLFLIA